MTMPKKGRRKIVVDGETCYYMIKPLIYGNENDCARLTIETSDGIYISKQYQEAITPAMVEALILEDR